MLLDAKLHELKKFLLISPEIFISYVDRYGEHYGNIYMQRNTHKKGYCTIDNNC